MNFSAPEQLWWLLLLPLLIWLALPPRPRRITWTPHLELIERAMAARRVRPPRRSNVRLLLLLLACAAVVLAHAGLGRPAVPGPQRLVVLLDASTSMAARDQGAEESRFAAAVQQVRTRLRDVPDDVEVTLLRCGGELLRRHGPFARQVHDVGAPGGALLAELAPLAAGLPDDTAVWTVTDGQGTAALPERGALMLFGAAADNAAVVAVQLDDAWPLPELRAEVDIVAFAAAPAAIVLDVAGDAVEPLRQEVTLETALPRRLSLPLTRRAAGGSLRVSVTMAGDALSADDTWSCVLPPLPAPTIAVLTDPEGGPYANVAAAALAAEVGGQVVAAGRGASAALLLVDGGEVDLQPGTQRALCFGSRLSGRPAGAVVLEPRVTDWDRRHALTADLDLSGLRVMVALPETLPEGVPFLFGADAQAGTMPLAVVAGDGERRSLHFAFRLADSNLPLLPAFPQLLRRAFVQAYGTAAAASEVRLPLAAGEQDLQQVQRGEGRPLPPFGRPRQSYSGLCLWGALLLLVLRGLCR